jgi:hypothetical protein
MRALPGERLLGWTLERTDRRDARGTISRVLLVGDCPGSFDNEGGSLPENGNQRLVEGIGAVGISPDRPPERQIPAVNQGIGAALEADGGIDPVERRGRSRQVEGLLHQGGIFELRDDDLDGSANCPLAEAPSQ